MLTPTDRQCVSTERAPGAVGPYSQAVKTGNTLFVSGQVGLIPGVSPFSSEHGFVAVLA